jgi:hypothetical protein
MDKKLDYLGVEHDVTKADEKIWPKLIPYTTKYCIT